MASSSTADIKKFYEAMIHFPPIINGRINIVQYIEACSDLVSLVDRLGTLFAPVKYDMQGNIDKIKKYYEYDENSCLLELMVTETHKGKPGQESVLWLNRALLFFEILFQEIVAALQGYTSEVNAKKLFTIAYEGSVKKYHNWVTQQIFAFILKTSPTFPQLLKSMDVEDVKDFQPKLTNYNIKLHLVRCKIDDCFRENRLLEDY